MAGISGSEPMSRLSKAFWCSVLWCSCGSPESRWTISTPTAQQTSPCGFNCDYLVRRCTSTTPRWAVGRQTLTISLRPHFQHGAMFGGQTANAIVFLWPQDMKPESKDNANILLAYWRGGLINRFGRVWACWGDLRAERVKRSQLNAAAQK